MSKRRELFTVPREAQSGYKARYEGFYEDEGKERASVPEGLCSVRKSMKRELKIFGAPVDEYMIVNDRSGDDDALNSVSGHDRLAAMVRNTWSYVHAELGKGRGKHWRWGGLENYDSVLATRSPRIVFSAKTLQGRLSAGRFPTILIDKNLNWTGGCEAEPLCGNPDLLVNANVGAVYNKETGKFHKCNRRKEPAPSLAVYREAPESDVIELFRNSPAFRHMHGLPRLEPLGGTTTLLVTAPFKTWFARAYELDLSPLFGWDFERWSQRVKKTMATRVRKHGLHPAALRFDDPKIYGDNPFHMIWRRFAHGVHHSGKPEDTPSDILSAVPPTCRLSRRQACCILHAAEYSFDRCRKCRVPFGCEPRSSEKWTQHPLWQNAIPNREYLIALAGKLKRRHRQWLVVKERDPDNELWPDFHFGNIPPSEEQLLADYDSLLRYGAERAGRRRSKEAA